MPGFDSIIGQRLPIRLLKQFLVKGSVPHALLFTGIAGIGKRTTASIFAMALNCQAEQPAGGGDASLEVQRPCGRCQPCRRIAAGSYPDVVCIEPHKNALRIDQIRNLLGILAMKPFGSGRRVVVIRDAQSLTPEAGNALLKVLEEPPLGTVMILTALQRSDLLPTIVSRCRHIHFHPLAPDDLSGLLIAHTGVDRAQAATIAEQAAGSFAQARRLATDQWTSRRDWLVQAAGLIQPRDPSDRPITLALAFAAQLALRKEKVQELLEIIKTWIRDLAVLPYAADRVINLDRLSVLNQARSGLSDQRVLWLWQAVEKAQKDIAANANLRLTLDVMALRMAASAAK